MPTVTAGTFAAVAVGAYSSQRQRTVCHRASSCLPASPVSVSSSPPLHLPLSPSLAPPSASWRRCQAQPDEWCRGGEGFAKCWHEKPSPLCRYSEKQQQQIKWKGNSCETFKMNHLCKLLALRESFSQYWSFTHFVFHVSGCLWWPQEDLCKVTLHICKS